jgi:AraC-like DNA-binding protein
MQIQSIVAPVARPIGKFDLFGCPSSRLSKDQELRGNGVRFFRKSSDDSHLGHVETAADDRGILVGVSQLRGHSRKIFHEHHASLHDFGDDAIYVRNLSDPYRADLSGAFDFLLVELSRSFLDHLVDEEGGRRSGGLTCCAGSSDPVVAAMLRAVRPALAKSGEASTLFLDQVGIAIGTHLFERYGRAALPSPKYRAGLSRAQLTLAKDMLLGHPGGDVSIAEIACACRLSRGYFIRAFQETTGETPHRWVLIQRIERARGLLLESDLSLADVALICGFSDQSHFTRVFARITGTPPGHWRRAARI